MAKEPKEYCQSEVHHSRFIRSDGSVVPHYAENWDHFTPKCIIRCRLLNKSLLTSEENLIHANKLCHAIKDAETPQMLEDAKKQRAGQFIGYDFINMWYSYLERVKRKEAMNGGRNQYLQAERV